MNHTSISNGGTPPPSGLPAATIAPLLPSTLPPPAGSLPIMPTLPLNGLPTLHPIQPLSVVPAGSLLASAPPLLPSTGTASRFPPPLSSLPSQTIPSAPVMPLGTYVPLPSTGITAIQPIPATTLLSTAPTAAAQTPHALSTIPILPAIPNSSSNHIVPPASMNNLIGLSIPHNNNNSASTSASASASASPSHTTTSAQPLIPLANPPVETKGTFVNTAPATGSAPVLHSHGVGVVPIAPGVAQTGSISTSNAANVTSLPGPTILPLSSALPLPSVLPPAVSHTPSQSSNNVLDTIDSPQQTQITPNSTNNDPNITATPGDNYDTIDEHVPSATNPQFAVTPIAANPFAQNNAVSPLIKPAQAHPPIQSAQDASAAQLAAHEDHVTIPVTQSAPTMNHDEPTVVPLLTPAAPLQPPTQLSLQPSNISHHQPVTQPIASTRSSTKELQYHQQLRQDPITPKPLPTELGPNQKLMHGEVCFVDQEGNVTRCPCGENHKQIEFMISCDGCEVWQHGDCIGIIEGHDPDHYWCEFCKPNHQIHTKRRNLAPNGRFFLKGQIQEIMRLEEERAAAEAAEKAKNRGGKPGRKGRGRHSVLPNISASIAAPTQTHYESQPSQSQMQQQYSNQYYGSTAQHVDAQNYPAEITSTLMCDEVTAAVPDDAPQQYQLDLDQQQQLILQQQLQQQQQQPPVTHKTIIDRDRYHLPPTQEIENLETYRKYLTTLPSFLTSPLLYDRPNLPLPPQFFHPDSSQLTFDEETEEYIKALYIRYQQHTSQPDQHHIAPEHMQYMYNNFYSISFWATVRGFSLPLWHSVEFYIASILPECANNEANMEAALAQYSAQLRAMEFQQQDQQQQQLLLLQQQQQREQQQLSPELASGKGSSSSSRRLTRLPPAEVSQSSAKPPSTSQQSRKRQQQQQDYDEELLQQQQLQQQQLQMQQQQQQQADHTHQQYHHLQQLPQPQYLSINSLYSNLFFNSEHSEAIFTNPNTSTLLPNAAQSCGPYPIHDNRNKNQLFEQKRNFLNMTRAYDALERKIRENAQLENDIIQGQVFLQNNQDMLYHQMHTYASMNEAEKQNLAGPPRSIYPPSYTMRKLPNIPGYTKPFYLDFAKREYAKNTAVSTLDDGMSAKMNSTAVSQINKAKSQAVTTFLDNHDTMNKRFYKLYQIEQQEAAANLNKKQLQSQDSRPQYYFHNSSDDGLVYKYTNYEHEHLANAQNPENQKQLGDSITPKNLIDIHTIDEITLQTAVDSQNKDESFSKNIMPFIIGPALARKCPELQDNYSQMLSLAKEAYKRENGRFSTKLHEDVDKVNIDIIVEQFNDAYTNALERQRLNLVDKLTSAQKTTEEAMSDSTITEINPNVDQHASIQEDTSPADSTAQSSSPLFNTASVKRTFQDMTDGEEETISAKRQKDNNNNKNNNYILRNDEFTHHPQNQIDDHAIVQLQQFSEGANNAEQPAEISVQEEHVYETITKDISTELTASPPPVQPSANELQEIVVSSLMTDSEDDDNIALQSQPAAEPNNDQTPPIDEAPVVDKTPIDVVVETETSALAPVTQVPPAIVQDAEMTEPATVQDDFAIVVDAIADSVTEQPASIDEEQPLEPIMEIPIDPVNFSESVLEEEHTPHVIEEVSAAPIDESAAVLVQEHEAQ